MRRLPLAIGVVSSVLWVGGGSCLAQQQDPPQQGRTQQQAQDAAPPQKKPADKTEPSRDSDASGKPSDPADSSPKKSSAAGRSAAEQNPFPEDVSRSAAKAEEPAAGSTSEKPSSNAPHTTADDNPFPEGISRSAEKAAENADDLPAAPAANSESSQPENPLPPGVSSSRSSGFPDDAGDIPPGIKEGSRGRKSLEGGNQARAKEDTQVGEFYLKHGNAQGAYLRYKDAIASDPANVDAIFGLAEAARQLKKYPEAERNYELYLEVIPDGRKAKEASKALSLLTAR